MPWYVSMLTVFCFVYKKHRYKSLTILFFCGLHEVGADGIFGHILKGQPVPAGYLFFIFFIHYWLFIIIYAPIVLLPVFAYPETSSVNKNSIMKILALFLPLFPLVPYYLIVNFVFLK